MSCHDFDRGARKRYRVTVSGPSGAASFVWVCARTVDEAREIVRRRGSEVLSVAEVGYV